jgi:hypothetical protein
MKDTWSILRFYYDEKYRMQNNLRIRMITVFILAIESMSGDFQFTVFVMIQNKR